LPKQISLVGSILIFLSFFALWQIYDLIILNIRLSALYIYLVYLAIPTVGLAIFAIFTKATKSTFKRQGYKKPDGISTQQCLFLSILFIAIYLGIYLLSGFRGIYEYTGLSDSLFLIAHRIAWAVILSLASESVFRGYIFRNLVKNYGFFTSLYVSSIFFGIYRISIIDLLAETNIIIYVFTRILPQVVTGLFLGFFFYKIGWSLLGPIIFQIGVIFFFDPLPIISLSGPPWWMALTVEVMSFAALILIADYLVKEPKYRRRRYGLEG